MMKKVIKLSASVLATVVLSLACGHGTAAMNRAAAVSVFSPNNSTLPMCTSTVSGMTGFDSAAASSTLSKSAIISSSSAMNTSSSAAGTTNVSDNSGNTSSPANNSGKSGSNSGTVTHSKDAGKTTGGSGTVAPARSSGNTGGGSTTSGKKSKNSDGSTDINKRVVSAVDTHIAEAAYNINAIQNELIAYGESKGLHYNSSLRVEDSGYEFPISILQDTLNEADFVQQAKCAIDSVIKSRGIEGADFKPYFERKSNKTNDYWVYELYG